jgi:hypothetical protein
MVRWKKGLKAADIIKMILDEEVTLPALIHFRIATSGGVRPELCHPFPISANASTDLQGRAKTVLVHNGHWSNWGSKVLNRMSRESRAAKGHWSDSRALAWLAARYGNAVFEMVSGQRIATLEGEKGLLIMWGDWDKEGGVYFSNKIWKWKTEKNAEWSGFAKSGYHRGGNSINWEATYESEDEMIDLSDKNYPFYGADHV